MPKSLRPQQFSDGAKFYEQEMHSHNAKAAEMIFRTQNACYSRDSLARVDLRGGLLVHEAVTYAIKHLENCRQSGLTSTVIIAETANGSRYDGEEDALAAIEDVLAQSDGLIWEKRGEDRIQVWLYMGDEDIPDSKSSSCILM